MYFDPLNPNSKSELSVWFSVPSKPQKKCSFRGVLNFFEVCSEFRAKLTILTSDSDSAGQNTWEYTSVVSRPRHFFFFVCLCNQRESGQLFKLNVRFHADLSNWRESLSVNSHRRYCPCVMKNWPKSLCKSQDTRFSIFRAQFWSCTFFFLATFHNFQRSADKRQGG